MSLDNSTILALHLLAIEHPEHANDGPYLALKYLEQIGEDDAVEDILRGRGRVPTGMLSRRDRLAWMRDCGRADLAYIAEVIEQSTKTTSQYWVARWVKLYVEKGMSPDQAAWKVSKLSDPNAPIRDGEARKAYAREFELTQQK